MCGSTVYIKSPTAAIRRGKKKEEKRQKSQGKNKMSAPIT